MIFFFWSGVAGTAKSDTDTNGTTTELASVAIAFSVSDSGTGAQNAVQSIPAIGKRPKLYLEVDWNGTYGSQTYAQTVLNNGPATYYRLKETSGSTAADASGNGNNGTFVGSTLNQTPSPVTGDATSRYIGITTGQGISFTGPKLGKTVTLMAWIYKGSFTGTNRFFIAENNATAGNYIGFYVTGDRKLGVQLNASSITSTVSPLADATWTHYAVVINQDTRAITFYINGVAVETFVKNAQRWNLGAVTNSWFLGGAKTGTQLTVDRMAEPAVFDYELQPQDILDIYNSAPNTSPPAPSWTNIGDRLRGTTKIKYGSRNELGVVEPATLEFQLKNTDRRFEPEYTSSIYYPNIKPRRHIRLRAEWPTGTFYTLFDGYVQDWVQSSEAPTDGLANVTCVDGLSVLSTIPIGPRNYSMQKVGARGDRVLNIAGWPASTRSLETGVYDLAAETVSESENASQHLLEMGWAENGTFFISRDGTAKMWSATHKTTATRSTTSQATFADYAQAGKFFYEEMEWSAGADWILNEVSVTKPGGSAYTLVDSASRADFWPSPYSTTVRLSGDADVSTRAASILARYKDFRLRPQKITFSPDQDPSNLYPIVLAAERWDRYTLERTPQGVGAVKSFQVFLEGMEVTITDTSWFCDWSVSLV